MFFIDFVLLLIVVVFDALVAAKVGKVQQERLQQPEPTIFLHQWSGTKRGTSCQQVR